VNLQELIALVDRLRSEPAETEWLEFKSNYTDSQRLGEYLSALANAACLHGKPRGYIVYGIDNATHAVTGTTFDPEKTAGKGNQALLLWLSQHLQPPVTFEVHPITHPGGRVVLFEVWPAENRPVCFQNTAYIRVGSHCVELKKFPEKERAIWHGRQDWSAIVREGVTVADLDPEALRMAREQFIIKHPGQAGLVAEWDDLTFLNKARLAVRGGITNAAILLLGRIESTSLLSPAVAKISWILKDADNRELDYEHFGPPFLLAGDRLLRRIRNLTVRTLPGGTLFPQEMTQYDPWVIREALHNCIAHQDYSLRGRISVVETPDALLLTNPGSFIPGSVENVIRQDAPPDVYRNPFLADAMVALNMIDTQGGGIKRMFQRQRQRFFPLPDYDLADEKRVVVRLNGRIMDENYSRLLMERGDLTLGQVMLLDRVQKRLPITLEAHQALKKAGLVEGRYPLSIVAGAIARTTGQKARHIRERGFDTKYYLDLILELVRVHGPVTREDINQLLFDKLPETLTPEQRRIKIHNLLGSLARKKRIVNRGSRGSPQWVLQVDPLV